MEYVTLYNVVDTRTGQEHSVAVVREKNVKYFVEAEPPEEQQEEQEEDDG